MPKMTSLQRLFNPLRHAAAAFFKQDLTVRREGHEVRLVLEERSKAKPQVQARVQEAQRKESAELAQMRAELAALLNELPETRQTMRHLVFVEQALARKGLKALHKVPFDVLQRALDQLEGLVVNWSPEGLANLRSKMAVAVIDREHMDPNADGDAYRTTAALDQGAVTTIVLETTVEEAASQQLSDEEALAAAYAALGTLAAPGTSGTEGEGPADGANADPADASPAAESGADRPGPAVQMQGELGSGSAKAVQRVQNAAQPRAPAESLRIRELHN